MNNQFPYKRQKCLIDLRKSIHQIIRKIFKNRYKYIHNVWSEIHDVINHTFKRDNERFIHIFHTEPHFQRVRDQRAAWASKYIKTFVPNNIPIDHFEQELLAKKVNKNYLVYFDTRSLGRRPEEVNKPWYKISDECERVA